MFDATGIGLWVNDRGLLHDGIDLSAGEGEITLVTGRNGSGASLLLAALVGQGPSGSRRSGQITLARHDVSWATPRDLAPHVLRLGETAPTGSLSVRESIEAAAPHRPWAHAADLIERLGLTASTGRRLSDLTFSARHRAWLAGALLGPARTLLVDQPLARLESAWRTVVCELLREAADAGRAIIMAEHELVHAVEIADQVLELGSSTGQQPIHQWRPQALPWPLQHHLAAVFDLDGHPWRTIAGCREAFIARHLTLPPPVPKTRRDTGTLAVGLGDRQWIMPDHGPSAVICADEESVHHWGRALGAPHPSGPLPTATPDRSRSIADLARHADRSARLPAGTTLERMTAVINQLRPQAALMHHSPGEQRQLTAMLTTARVPMILVDPMRHLDAAARRHLTQRAQTQRASIVVTSDVEVTAWTERALAVSGERIVADGHCAAILTHLAARPALSRFAYPQPYLNVDELVATTRTAMP